MNRRSSFRFATLVAVFALVLSACAVGTDNKATLSMPGERGPVISPFMTGLWASETSGHSNQLQTYLNWFRGNGSEVAPSASGAILDPSCPLEYDYASMSTASRGLGQWGDDGGDGLYIAEVQGQTGFYNPARMEVLFLLRGHTFDFAHGGSNHNCDNANDADLAAYVPVRLSLGQGVWELDGWASPASTITVSVAQGFPMVPVKDDTHIADDHNIISPFRLARFQITPENFGRVIRYAALNDDGQGYSRKMIWFRESDISPSYGHAANSICKPAFFAFWSKGDNDGEKSVIDCQAAAFDLNNRDGSTVIDRMSRMSGVDEIWRNTDDDSCTAFNSTSCNKIDNGDWQVIAKQLSRLVDKRENYKTVMTELHTMLKNYDRGHPGFNLETNFAPPDEFGGWANPDPNLFAIIASGGKKAMDETKDIIANGKANQKLVGFVGATPLGDVAGSVNTVTLSPSFSYASVKTDEAASAFYDKYSLVMNSGQKAFNVMAFSTSGAGAAGAKLPFDQSPLAQITVKVADSLNAGNASTYISNWIPVMAVGRNAGSLSIRKNIDLLGNFGGAVAQAVSDLMYGIYRSTVGGWLSSLAQQATGNLLAVPSLDPFEVSYQKPDGSAVYILNADLIRWDVAINNWFHGHKDNIAAGLTGDAAVCTAAAWSGQLTDPNAVISVGGKGFPVAPCFRQNGTYALFNIVRGFSLLLVVLLMGRYILALMQGGAERRKFGIPAFFARCVFVFALIVGMDVILRVMGVIVAETVLVTNLVGTQAGGGTPYSHLWLFSAYLNSPSRDISVFAMIIMAPFLLLGLFVLLVSNWLRFGMTYFVVGVSPLWSISLLNSQRPAFFYRSMLWLVRLYLIPLLTLVVLLVLFIVVRMVGMNASDANLISAVVGMVMLIAVAILPAMLAKAIIGMAAQPIQNAVSGALQSIESHSGSVALDAIGSGSTTAEAKAAAERRDQSFKLPGGKPGETPALGSGGIPSASAASLAPVAGPGGAGPASARIGAGGYGGVAAGVSWAPPAQAGAWTVPAHIPQAGAGATGGLAGVATPPAPTMPALTAGEEATKDTALDLNRGSLKMRIVRGAGRRTMGAAVAAGLNVAGVSEVMDPFAAERLKYGMRSAVGLVAGEDFRKATTDRWTEAQIEKYGPLAPVMVDGKPLMDASGKQIMTPGGRPPSDVHDHLVAGLSHLTGTSMISDGFDPDGRTGKALARLDKGTRRMEGATFAQKQRLDGMHGAPASIAAMSEHSSALAGLKAATDALAAPRRTLIETVNRSTDPANDPAVAGARRALAQAETALAAQQTRARTAWDKVASLQYEPPVVGDGQHVAREQIVFEEKRSQLLQQLLDTNKIAADGLGLDVAALNNVKLNAAGLGQDHLDTVQRALSSTQSETAQLVKTAAERHEKSLLLAHDYRQASVSRGPALKILPRRS